MVIRTLMLPNILYREKILSFMQYASSSILNLSSCEYFDAEQLMYAREPLMID